MAQMFSARTGGVHHLLTHRSFSPSRAIALFLGWDAIYSKNVYHEELHYSFHVRHWRNLLGRARATHPRYSYTEVLQSNLVVSAERNISPHAVSIRRTRNGSKALSTGRAQIRSGRKSDAQPPRLTLDIWKNSAQHSERTTQASSTPETSGIRF